MSIDIRLARASDLDALVAIEEAAFSSDRLSRRSLARLIGASTAAVLVLAENGAIAGFCVLLFRKGSRSARLYSIAVAPTMPSRGRGKTLLAAAEAEAARRGAGTQRLEVREDNQRAIALYCGAGYRQIGRRPGYYADGAAALVFRKMLATSDAADAATTRAGGRA